MQCSCSPPSSPQLLRSVDEPKALDISKHTHSDETARNGICGGDHPPERCRIRRPPSTWLHAQLDQNPIGEVAVARVIEVNALVSEIDVARPETKRA